MSSNLDKVIIAVIGGDERELYLVPELLRTGAIIRVIGLPNLGQHPGLQHCDNIKEAVRGAQVIKLPMPGIDPRGQVRALDAKTRLIIDEAVMECVSPDAIIITGVARPELKELVGGKNRKLIELAEMDEVAIFNSIPSAEGAIQMAMEATPVTIHGSCSMVIGFGRTGKTLARVLAAMGAKVSVVARKSADWARIYEMGYEPLNYSQLGERIADADVVYNTVPAMVLSREVLQKCKPDLLVIDLASAPGGTDFQAAESLGIKAILAPGLPGRVAPKTAGLMLARVIPDLIRKELRLVAKAFNGSGKQVGGADMRLKDKRIGFAVTGSHCTLKEALGQVEFFLKEGAMVIPIMSDSVNNENTRFGTGTEWKELLKRTCNNEPINSIVKAEPIGPQKLLDVLVVAPCTGNTLAKLANGITDTPVLMAIKAHLRNQRPVVLAIATNDGLGVNAKNIGLLLNMKNIYMVPFGQDNPQGKANSLVAHMSLLLDTTLEALKGKQYQPLLVDYRE